MLQKLEQQISGLKQDYAKRSAEAEYIRSQKKEKEEQLEALKESLQVQEEARILLQKAGTEARESARSRLEDTVTDALRYVFGPDFRFAIEVKESRGRAEAEFYVESMYDGEVVKTKPEDSRGGGVVDIISIALRVALIQIHADPRIRGPIILDEPGKHVSADYTMKLANFLKQVSQTFGRQIIISTHQPDLAAIADRSLSVQIKGGKSVVEEVVQNI